MLSSENNSVTLYDVKAALFKSRTLLLPNAFAGLVTALNGVIS